MTQRAKIRGIYTTALTKLLLNSGYTIVDPSPETQQRFSLPPFQEVPDLIIQDREDHQGVDITGESYQLTILVRLLQETLFDAVLLEFATQDETEMDRETAEEEAPQDIARARFEFPATSKAYLDAIRSTVTPSLTKHHRLKVIQAKKLGRFELECLQGLGKKNQLEKNLFAEMVLVPLEKAGTVRLEQVKVSGKSIRPREGVLVAMRGEQLTIKRSFSQGRYDGLGLPIEEGDYALTEVEEGAWFVKHAYYSKKGKTKGEYFNINTPVELYPYGARYVDLEIDVIRRPGEKPVVVDREELAVLVQKGVVSGLLEKKAQETAESLLKKIG